MESKLVVAPMAEAIKLSSWFSALESSSGLKRRVGGSRGMMFPVGTADCQGQAEGTQKKKKKKGRRISEGPSQDFREFNIVLGASADSPGV